MTRLMGFVGMTAGGWIGWTIGDQVSFFTAFMLSVVGTGVGLWLGRRFAARYS